MRAPPEGGAKRHSQPMKTELLTTQKLRSGKPRSSLRYCILAGGFQRLFYVSGRTSFDRQNDLAKNLGRNPNNQGNKSHFFIFPKPPKLQGSRGVKLAPRRRSQPTSAIIRPGASPALPTSGNSSRAHFEAVFSPQKPRFPFDGAIFGPKTSTTPKCVGDYELISS